MPQQVQYFYPTPGTLSTAMYYTGLDPRTMQPVYVAKTAEEKAMQRALLQWRRPDKRPIVVAALKKAGREDLIGFGKDCLIRPLPGEHWQKPAEHGKKKAEHGGRKAEHGKIRPEHGGRKAEHGARPPKHGGRPAEHEAPRRTVGPRKGRKR